jgi:hypothetical protein
MLSPEYDAIKAMEGPGIHVTATGTYVNYKGIPETVSYTVANPDAPPVDVPSMFYRDGYEAGIKAASKILVQHSREAYCMYRNPPHWVDDFGVSRYEYQNLARSLARIGTKVRELLR